MNILVDQLLYPPLGVLITLTGAFVWLFIGILLSDNVGDNHPYESDVGAVLMVIGCVLLLNGLPTLFLTPPDGMPFTCLGNIITHVLAFGTMPLWLVLDWYYVRKARKLYTSRRKLHLDPSSWGRSALRSERGSDHTRAQLTNPRVLHIELRLKDTSEKGKE
jgi:hypothetical protein